MPMDKYANEVPHHDTYLGGIRIQRGWPYDHSVDDTYECPPHTWKPNSTDPTGLPLEAEYFARFSNSGEAHLVLRTAEFKFIAKFDTMADAQTAAEALNNLKGY